MRLKIVLLVFLMLSFVANAQQELWSEASGYALESSDLSIKKLPKEYKVYSLNKSSFQIKQDQFTVNDNEPIEISLPNLKGSSTYILNRTHVLAPDLAKKYPNIKSFVGYEKENKYRTVRVLYTNFGLKVMFVDEHRKISFLEPVSTVEGSQYLLYERSKLSMDDFDMQCSFEELSVQKKSTSFKNVNDRQLRTYKMALASTGEYSNYHVILAGISGASDEVKKEFILGQMALAVTRVNDLYEKDLAISFQLVSNNDELIFLDADADPYTNDDGSALLTQNQNTCDDIIGLSNYDIGHVFSTDGTVSRAVLSSTCTVSKAKGVTGSSNPIGDNFYYDFFAHEIGHQMGAHHSFNGDQGSCKGNVNQDTAVEPGSGSTIMGYAGVCTTQNIQAHSDLYFHAASINEISANFKDNNASTCGIKSELTENLHVPVANAGSDYVIPKSTPYVLKGIGSDQDNDPISFAWEQMDNKTGSVPPKPTDAVGPLYRSKLPSESPNRYMPDLNTLVKGNLSSTWEVTPSESREINFRLTVRDNNIQGGQLDDDDMKITVTDQAGPFVVTSQSEEGLIWDKGTTQTISWDVAGTNSNGVNVSKVNILLSTDGGRSFDQILKSNTNNDGQEVIDVPQNGASNCFVMVEAVDNVFFSMNKKSFSIGNFVEECEPYVSNDTPIDIPDNNINGLVSNIEINNDLIIDKIQIHAKGTHTWMADLAFTLESPNGEVFELVRNVCSDNDNFDVIFEDLGNPLSCSTVPPAIRGSVSPVDEFNSLIGTNARGIWKLRIVDEVQDDVGTLENWGVTICTSEEVVSVKSYEFENFRVYPNPNNGSFKVSFNIEEFTDVSISVFDLLGRRIFSKNYNVKGIRFIEDFNLNKINSGIYVLKVQQGSRISSRKINIF